ncbi:MAG: phosphoenolpyruvate carboxylase, partial [Methylobacterium sp.]
MRMHDLNPADAAHDPGHDQQGAESLERDLLRLIEESREQAAEDPFRNPVLAVTLAITRRFDRGEIGEDDLDALFPRLRSHSLASRAERLRAYVGLDRDAVSAPDSRMAARLVAAVPARQGDFETFRDLVGRTGFSVVFTAHPTFGMPRAVATLIAQAASQAEGTAREPLLARAAA